MMCSIPSIKSLGYILTSWQSSLLTQTYLPQRLLYSLIAASLVTIVSSQPYIIEGPEDQTVFLDPKKYAIFTCETSSYDAAIYVFTNGTIQRNDDVYMEHSTPPPFISTIKIKQITKYNNSTIKCESGNETAVSWLQIQGPPEAVSNLRVQRSGDNLTVTWQAPTTLDVTGVEYDLLYSLNITDITNETQTIPLACDICHNLTETKYIFSPPESLLEHSFNFTVTPYNGAGKGLSRTVLFNKGLSLPTTPGGSLPTTPSANEDQGIQMLPFIVIAFVVFIVGLGVVVVILWLYKKKQKRQSALPDSTPTNQFNIERELNYSSHDIAYRDSATAPSNNGRTEYEHDSETDSPSKPELGHAFEPSKEFKR